LNKTIYHLKKTIVIKNPKTFPDIDPKDLQLFKADIPATKPARKAFVFNDGAELEGVDVLSDVFEGGLLKKKHIRIAIKRPSKYLSFLLNIIANNQSSSFSKRAAAR